MIDVVAAIIGKNNKLLICQRAKGKHCELLWEFPGGKIESGETPEEALVRECKEELDVTIKPGNFLCKVEHEYPDITVNIHFYFCKITDGKPVCKEHHKIQWSTRDEISKRTLCPADQKMWEAEYKTIDEFVQYNFAKQKYDEVVSENIHNF